MTLLRTMVTLLLLANLVFLLGGRSLFGGSSSGEAGRFAAQIDPQRIRLLQPGEQAVPTTEQPAPRGEGTRPQTQSADKKAPEGKAETPPQVERCIAVAGLTAEQAAVLKARASDEDGLKVSERGLEGSSWWVNLPPLADRESAVKRAEEVRTQGVAGAFIIREDGEHRNAVSLGLFKSEAAAQEFMRQLQSKGVQGARITVRSVPGTRHTLDMRGPADRVAELVELAMAANSAARREQCAGR